MATSQDQNQLHFVLFPIMAQGHMIPMIDSAKLFAQHGVIVTIVTTPFYASRFKATIDHTVEIGLRIRLIEVKIPFEEAGLADGCESFNMTTSPELTTKLFYATSLLQKPAEKLLEELKPPPSCIISDYSLPWTINIAHKFHVPRIVFQVSSVFSNVILSKVFASKVKQSTITSKLESFVVPDLPHKIEITKAQLPIDTFPNIENFVRQVVEADEASYGVIFNSFEELESEYVKEFKKVKRDKVWCIGPVSLCNKEYIDKSQRGNKSSIDEEQCLKWLNSRDTCSVVYACLGSHCNLTTSQLIELGLGLEESNRPFIWVIKEESNLEELKNWTVKEGFEERNKNKGLLIWGWAPQLMILSHPSIGGFLTHCGWNSTIEALCNGVPLVTWPLFSDQFLVEKLIEKVLKVGVRVGVEILLKWGEEEKIGVLVTKEDVKNAINKMMNEGEESKERRERTIKLGEMAKRAVEEGGSSYLNITCLIEDIERLANP